MGDSNPNTQMGIFFGVTIIYFGIDMYITTAQTQLAWRIFYILLVITLQLSANVQLTTTLCGSAQIKTAVLYTLFPWLMIFAILDAVLTMFPGWLIPFSNTFGYVYVQFGLTKIIGNLLKSQDSVKYNKEMYKTLGEIYHDPSLLINEIPDSLAGFDKFWTELEGSNLLRDSPDKKDNMEALRSKVRVKNNISKFIWYSLAGMLTISATYNYIINSACTQSVQEMEKSYLAYQKQIAKKDADTTKPRIYSTHE